VALSAVKDLVAKECNGVCRHSNELANSSQLVGAESQVVQVALGFLRRFL
jgi:hypothetical protein